MTGEAIRAAREARGWTRAHLARQVGMTPDGLRLIEIGTSRPRADTLEAIEGVLSAEATRSDSGLLRVVRAWERGGQIRRTLEAVADASFPRAHDAAAAAAC